MDIRTNPFLVFFLLFLFLSDTCAASSLWNHRKLVDKVENSTLTQVSPEPSPVLSGEKTTREPPSDVDIPIKKNPSTNSTAIESNKPDSVTPPPQQQQTANEKEDPKRTELRTPPPDQEKSEKGSNQTESLNPPQNNTEIEKNDEKPSKTDSSVPSEVPPSEVEKTLDDKDLVSAPPLPPSPVKKEEKEDVDKASSESKGSETCIGMSHRCTDEKTLVACLTDTPIGSQEWVVLVQNQGEATLKVNVFLPTSIESPLKELEIPKKQSQRVNISIVGNIDKLLLDAGHGECVLHMDSADSDPNVNFFLRLPSYQKLLTPINGAYFLIISVIVFGLTWAFCKFRKRKRTDEIPYQELEMGTSESAGIPVETAEGWDNSWDDDWDDDAAVKSPGAGGHQVRRVSANGLTSRSTNKDGWDNDWDD